MQGLVAQRGLAAATKPMLSAISVVQDPNTEVTEALRDLCVRSLQHRGHREELAKKTRFYRLAMQTVLVGLRLFKEWKPSSGRVYRGRGRYGPRV
jgi:hypothetical protein